MDELHRSILRKNISKLTKEIVDIEEVCDYLIEKDILSESMRQTILAEKTDIGKARKMLDILPKRGPNAFSVFCNALIMTKQRFLAEHLNPELKNSGVTPLPPESEIKESAMKSTSHDAENDKAKAKASSFPVPVQLPVSDKSSSLPDIPPPASTSAGSQPTTPDEEKYQPAVGTRPSKNKTQASIGDVSLKKLPPPLKGWPGNLDMSLTSKEFQIKYCSEQEMEQQRALGEQVYAMDKDKIKRALIINIQHFDDEKYESRSAADMDFFRLQQILLALDFKCEITTNVTKASLMKKLENERQQKGKSGLSVFVLIIMSYGGVGTIMCADGEMMPIEDVVSLFTTKKCPLMEGVPKVFLFQACGTILTDCQTAAAGDSEDKRNSDIEVIRRSMASLRLGSTSVLNSAESQNESDAGVSLHTSKSENMLSDPLILEDTNDMLVAMATVPDASKMAGLPYSSLFLLGLSYMICNYAKSNHFISLLEGVNQLKLSEKPSKQEECFRLPEKLCEFKHSFTRKLYLMPSDKKLTELANKSASGNKKDSSLQPAGGGSKQTAPFVEL